MIGGDLETTARAPARSMIRRFQAYASSHFLVPSAPCWPR
jgi:hypothetical protein